MCSSGMFLSATLQVNVVLFTTTYVPHGLYYDTTYAVALMASGDSSCYMQVPYLSS